jgi:hypothetical protein
MYGGMQSFAGSPGSQPEPSGPDQHTPSGLSWHDQRAGQSESASQARSITLQALTPLGRQTQLSGGSGVAGAASLPSGASAGSGGAGLPGIEGMGLPGIEGTGSAAPPLDAPPFAAGGAGSFPGVGRPELPPPVLPPHEHSSCSTHSNPAPQLAEV